jgi:ribosome-associated protein
VTDSKPSKSARKREHLALQKLGEELITLRESDLLSLSLDEELIDAVLEARQIKSHGALRRQKQYIGKIMRQIDPEPVRVALERVRR